MKYLQLLCFLLLIPVISHAQYKSVFGKKATSWNVLTEVMDANVTDSIYSIDDSLINGTIYKVARHHSGQLLCFLREDTTKGKVWVLQKDSIHEYLVMDASLRLWDSFAIAYNPDTYNYLYRYIRSIYTRDHQRYMSFTGRGYEDTISFIGGIGPNIGFFYKILSNMSIHYGSEDYLLCAYKDGERVYTNNSFNSELRGKCNAIISTGLKEFEKSEQVKVFPNPSASVTNFQFTNERRLRYLVSIYDQLGRLIDNVSTNGNTLKIDKGNKPAGIYYYRLLQQDKLISVGKIEFTP